MNHSTKTSFALTFLALALSACTATPVPVHEAPPRRPAEQTETAPAAAADEVVFPGETPGGVTLEAKQAELEAQGMSALGGPDDLPGLPDKVRFPAVSLGAERVHAAGAKASRGGELWVLYDNGLQLRVQWTVDKLPWPFDTPPVEPTGITYEALPVEGQPRFYRLDVGGVDARGFQQTTAETPDGPVDMPSILSWVDDGVEYSLSGIAIPLEDLVRVARAMK